MASTPSSLTVSITGTNDAPVVAIPLSDASTLEDQPFHFQVPADTFTDIDQGDHLTYAATLADGSSLPGWLTFDAVTRTFSGRPSNWDVAVLNVAVIATDTGGLSATSVFKLDVVNVNDAPIVLNHMADQHIDESHCDDRHRFSFAVPDNTFDDWDIVHGDSLSYSATLADGSKLPEWLRFDATTRTFSGASEEHGSRDIRISAIDQAGATVSQVFNLSSEKDSSHHHSGESDCGTPADTSQDELFVSSSVNDIIHAGNGKDVVAFARGNGQDSLYGGVGTDNTLVLEGGIQATDLALSRDGNDLILETGNGDQINLRNWYDTSANYKSVLDVVVMNDAISSFEHCSEGTGEHNTQHYDFMAVVGAFDQASAGSTTFQHWNAANSMLAAHMDDIGNNDALGSDLAYLRTMSSMTTSDSSSRLAESCLSQLSNPQLNQSLQGVRAD
ncbi:MAG: hypothetical protein GC149_12960 [Gammaproteobacteria bacterium]|nr:hypothetical protein [Gammaproteobacteria bacterium]